MRKTSPFTTIGVRLALPVILAATSSCGGGSTTGSNNNGNNGGNNGATSYTLTITTKAMDTGYIPGVIYAYIGDNIETRAHMPQILDENNAYVKPFGANSKTVTLTVPAGKYVTLFAAEFGKAGTNVRQNGVVSRIVAVSETEFSAWSGATGRLISSENGVTAIKMDADANVTGEFRKLEGFMVQFEGCPITDVGYTTPPYLGFGTTQGESQTPIGANTGLNSQAADWFFLYGKQGTVYTLVARPTATQPAGVVATAFLSWGGNAATTNCGGFTCQVTVPPVGVAAATLISKNTWLSTPPTIGCGQCVVASGTCSLRP